MRKNTLYLILILEKNEIDLNLELGNYPLTIAPNFNQFVNPDNHLRKQISISYIPQNDFEDFVIKMIPKLIPCSFLENYQNIKKSLKNIIGLKTQE